MPKVSQKKPAPKPKNDPRDELLELADEAIRALRNVARDSLDGLVSAYYQKRNQVRKELGR